MMALETEVLIIGAGPAGATLSLLLSQQYGIRTMVICRHKGTANTPRAHIFNQRAMEVMRDLGVEEELLNVSSDASDMAHTSWLHSLTGKEYGRLWSWGNDPARRGDYDSCSPCSMSDLPQSYLEPVLVRRSKEAGTDFWFNTEFVSFSEVDTHVETIVKDRSTGQAKTIKSRYLIGADGARSKVLEQLGIPVDGRTLNTAFNVHIRAAMSHYFQHRPGSLNWILNPEAPDWSAVGNFRMVRPWDEFVVSMHPAKRDGQPFEPTSEDILNRLYQMIGERTVPIEILSTYRWTINDQCARSWQQGRILCIGDATHRHPPINGLGSNTCISDAFNLAWKLAFVLKQWAGDSLLQTLTQERLPVGKGIVRRANDGMEVHRELWSVIGLNKDEREQAVHTMESPTRVGRQRRERFYACLEKVDDEVQALGIQMNQIYASSAATFTESSDMPPSCEEVNLLKTVVISTFPGHHLPHVWLAKDGQSHKVSSLDLVGKGHFTMLIGIEGEMWRRAAQEWSQNAGFDIKVFSIGMGCDYMDAYRQWRKVRGVSEDGVVLIRPDHFVAWRSDGLSAGHYAKLASVLHHCLAIPDRN